MAFLKDELWYQRFNLFKEYVSTENRLPSRHNTFEYKGFKLGQWYHNQIRALERGDLPINRKMELDRFCPEWSTRDRAAVNQVNRTMSESNRGNCSVDELIRNARKEGETRASSAGSIKKREMER